VSGRGPRRPGRHELGARRSAPTRVRLLLVRIRHAVCDDKARLEALAAKTDVLNRHSEGPLRATSSRETTVGYCTEGLMREEMEEGSRPLLTPLEAQNGRV